MKNHEQYVGVQCSGKEEVLSAGVLRTGRGEGPREGLWQECETPTVLKKGDWI